MPEDPRGPALPIKRTPAFKKLTAIVTSVDLIGTYTHYWKGRTTPCEKPDCEPCANGIPFRWHAYLAAEECDTGLHFLFETTAMAAEPFIEYRKHHGTLRGCFFQAARWNQKANGRILIRTKPADLNEKRIPEGPDLLKCLAILWDLPSNGVEVKDFNPDKRQTQVKTQTPKDPFQCETSSSLIARTTRSSLATNPVTNPATPESRASVSTPTEASDSMKPSDKTS